MDSKSFVDEIVKGAGKNGEGEEREERDKAEEGGEISDRLLAKVEDALDVIDPYGAPNQPQPTEDETPLQKKQREIDHEANTERRRAKAEILGRALKAVVLECIAESRGEGEHAE